MIRFLAFAFSSWQPSCKNRHYLPNPTIRLPRRSLHSGILLPSRLSIQLMWPTSCHFILLILLDMSMTIFLSRITSFQVYSLRNTRIKTLSIARIPFLYPLYVKRISWTITYRLFYLCCQVQSTIFVELFLRYQNW